MGAPKVDPDRRTRFVRSSDGKVIHVAGCRYAKTGIDWTWAESRSIAEVRATARRHGLHLCCVCRPCRPPDVDPAVAARAELAALKMRPQEPERYDPLWQLVHVLAGLLGARPEGRQR